MSANTKYGLLFLLLASVSIPAHSAYKCIDEKGNVSYQTTACPSDAEQIKTRIGSPKSASPENDTSEQEEFTSDQPMDSSQAMLTRQKIASVISALTPIRVSVMEYYSGNGDWPTQLADMGFNKESMTSSMIDSVKMGSNGDFLAELNSSLGDNKRIVLKPESVMGGTSIEWKCFANFTSELLSVAGHQLCESSAKPEVSTVALRSHTNTKTKSDSFLRPGEKKMLDHYEERGRKLREAKNRSAEEYRKRKEEEEKKVEEDKNSPLFPPNREDQPPYNPYQDLELR